MKAINLFLPLTLMLISLQVNADKDMVCNLDLLNSYNIQGLQVAQEVILEMCPNVHMSCCKKTDQLEMYANWIHSKEKELVETHYRHFTTVYSKLFEEILSVMKFAEKIVKKLEVKRIANCKVIAERILNFKTDDILAQVKLNLYKMEEFFTNTYQGFYCAICNAENHKYFDADKYTISFSEKFCRDIVEHTLPSVIFLYNDIIKYFNLISKFVLACDYKGDYKAEALIPKELIFVEDDVTSKHLSECRDFRNKKSWFIYCAEICNSFTMAKFSDFYEPHKDQIVDFTKFIKHTMETILINEARNSSADSSQKGQLNFRVLLDSDQTNQDNKDAQQDENPVIFQAGLQSKVKIETYKSVFGGEGISLYDDGRNALINTPMYNEIKTKLHLEHLSNQSNPNLSDQDQQLIAAMNNSAGLNIVGILLLWAFN